MYIYNSQQPPLKLKEYGRNVQRLITQLQYMQDRTVRNQYAQHILKMMGILDVAHNKALVDHTQKRWDDFCIIADYKIDVDSSYPIPDKELLQKKPQRLSYSNQTIKYRHCGRHIELFIKKALAIPETNQRLESLAAIAKVIKNLSTLWNKDNPGSNTILSILQNLAGKESEAAIEQLKSSGSFNFSNVTNTDKNRGVKRNASDAPSKDYPA